MSVSYCVVPGPAGDVFVAATPAGISLVLPAEVGEDAVHAALADAGPAHRVEPEQMPGSVAETLARGGLRSMAEAPLPVDRQGLTAFQRRVLDEVAAIPPGEVRTYGEVAAAVGHPGAARAVGTVMATNRWPFLIPCHRVVPRSGGLGSYAYGVEMKQSLLASEGWAGRAA